LGAQKLSKGGINSTIVDIRIILATALKSLSTGIILAHNHPSGKLVPSEADKKITKQLSEASNFMDIKLIDHLIIGPEEGYYSFVDEGMLL
jgi:DNA repair protein RadC